MNRRKFANLEIKKGFTLIEIVVAMAILFIAVAAFMPIFVYAVKNANSNNIRLSATNLAESELERINALDYAAIGTYTMVSGTKVYGNPGGEIERAKTITLGNKQFTVTTDIRWADQSTGNSMSFKKVQVSVQQLSAFTGLQIDYAVLNSLVTLEGERTIVEAGDVQINVLHRNAGKQNVRINMYKNSVLSTLGFTNSEGQITFAGMPAGSYSVEVNPSSSGMMVMPTGVVGTGYDTNWIFTRETTVELWTKKTPDNFIIDWPALLNLTLEDYGGNTIAHTGLRINVSPLNLTSMNVTMPMANLAATNLWPEWTYNLRIFPDTNDLNVFDLIAVNQLIPQSWNGIIGFGTGLQQLDRTLTVKSDQPTVQSAASRYQVAAPIASLMEAAPGSSITMNTNPSIGAIYYSIGNTNYNNIYDAAIKPTIPSAQKWTPQSPYVVNAITKTEVDGSRIMMDSPPASFRYITPNSSTVPFSVALTSATNDTIIHYTTNGTEPTASSPVYSGPITIDGNATIKALAVKTGWAASIISTFNYTMTPQVANPTAVPADGSINVTSASLSISTSGASLFYSIDGSAPTIPYIAPIPVLGITTIKAVAKKAGWMDSEIVAFNYNLLVAAPMASLPSGTYYGTQNVTFENVPANVSIRYTTSGSNPSASYGTLYAGSPISITQNRTLKAIAYLTAIPANISSISTYDYSILGQVAAPAATPRGGNFLASQSVTLTCLTPGATIYFRFGSSGNYSAYLSPISIASNKTFQAYATKSGLTNSNSISETYTVLTQIADPVANPTAGDYNIGNSLSGMPVFLTSPSSSLVPGIEIRYLLDPGSQVPSNTYGTLLVGSVLIPRDNNWHTIKAIAYKPNSPYSPSNVVTLSYKVK